MTLSASALRNVPLFANVEESRFNLLGATEETYQRGEVIARAHEPASSLFILQDGAVKELVSTPEGKEVILAIHGPGDLFGEVVTGADGLLPAGAVALYPSRVLRISRESWDRLVSNEPALHRAIDELIRRRVLDAWKLVRMLSRYTTEARLKSALLLLADRWGHAREGGIEIALDLTHRTLADLTGASREKVTRALGVLFKKGLVSTAQRRLIIPSLERLQHE
jgi:CRP-like cAMP-binding protein